MLLIMNIPLIGLFTRMLTIPLWFLVPAIAAVSAVGVYAVHSTTFDLLLMVGLGVLGYIMRKMHFPMSPLILASCWGRCWSRTCAARCPSATATWRSCGKAA
jgi:putative tricarboxylic transport membrane protein